MKKLSLVIPVGLLLSQTAQAGLLGEIAGVVVTSISQIRVESPALQQLGYNFQGHDLGVTNGTPFYAKIVIYDEEVAYLGPGDVVRDTRYWEPLSPQIPILALVYQDRAGTKYLGCASEVLTLSSGGSSRSLNWTIRISDIEGPDGRSLYWSYVPTYPQAEVRLASYSVDFPREDWNATAFVQVVNNSYFQGTVRIDGRERCFLGSTDIYTFVGRQVYGDRGREITVEVVFTDQGRFVGTWNRSFSVPTSGVRAYQFIVDPRDIRR